MCQPNILFFLLREFSWWFWIPLLDDLVSSTAFTREKGRGCCCWNAIWVPWHCCHYLQGKQCKISPPPTAINVFVCGRWHLRTCLQVKRVWKMHQCLLSSALDTFAPLPVFAREAKWEVAVIPWTAWSSWHASISLKMKQYGDVAMFVPLGTFIWICKWSRGKVDASLPSTIASVCKGNCPGVAVIPNCHLGTLAFLQVFAKLVLGNVFFSLIKS